MESPGAEQDRPWSEAVSSVATIELTGDEELDLPGSQWRAVVDAREPVGRVELEIIELLEWGEAQISTEEMIRRAEVKRANLGLRHGQAFVAKYRRIDLGFPAGTRILLPGTIAAERIDQIDQINQLEIRHLPYLRWDGREWRIYWRWDWDHPDRRWFPHTWFFRPRASDAHCPLT